MTRLLIDGDIIAMRSASVYKEDVQAASEHCRETLLWGMNELFPGEPCSTTVCLSCPTRRYFRHDIFPLYKAKRRDPPPSLSGVKDMLRREFPCAEIAGLEADDVMGLISTSLDPEECIVWADDKDMGTLPNIRWTRTGEPSTVVSVSSAAADRWWMVQTLAGDGVDGYAGIPRVGPIKAERILATAITMESMWRAVVGAYVGAGLTEADALVTARLARILRNGDYADGEVRLWEPPIG